jgi:rubrerythrin
VSVLSTRIVGDIKDLQEAIRIVKDVESGYHAAIEDSVSYWWAVDEDIIDSYTKLMNKSADEETRSALSSIIADLASHTEVLESMREAFKKMLKDVQRHAAMLQALDRESSELER